MSVAVFNYAVWAAMYPALAVTVPEPLAQAYFDQSTLILNNGVGSVVPLATTRLALYNLLVAHIATLNGADRGGLVGRINSASEGSVSVATEYAGPTNAAWFLQTPYGAQYWQSTAQYRSAVYVPGVPRYLGVPGYAPGGRGW